MSDDEIGGREIDVRRAVEGALSEGDFALAECLVAGQLEACGPSPGLAESRFMIARERGDWAACETIAAAARRDYPDSPVAGRMASFTMMRAQHYAAAARLMAAELTRFPRDVPILRRAAHCAKLLNEPKTQIDYLERLARLGDNAAGRWISVAQIQIALFLGDDALRSLGLASAWGASDASLAPLVARAHERAGRHSEAIAAWDAVLADPQSATDPDARSSLHKQNGYLRVLEESRAVADREALIACGTGGGPSARLKVVSPCGAIAALRDTSSRSVLLIFGGIAAMMGAAPPTLPQYLGTFRVNALSFSDPRGAFTMRGIETLGGSYEETQESLSRLVDSWAVDRLYAVGYSAGAYPALRHGLELGARRILLLSGSIEIPESEDVSPLAGRLLADLGDMRIDMRSHTMRHANRSEIIVAYRPEVADDAWQAEQLAGLSNVTLRSLPGARHAIGLNEDDLNPLIAELLADAT